MKLNRPILTIILIILLVIDLIFFSVALIGQKVLNEEFLNEMIYDFDYIDYLKDNESIKNSVNNYKYSFDVFNYIDKEEVKEVENKVVDNILSNEDTFIEYEDILQVLNNAVNKYEKINTVDIHEYIDDDIKEVAYELSNSFDNDSITGLHIVNGFVNSKIIYLFVIIAIVISTLIIIFEHINGCLINSIIYLIYSFAMYYLKYNFDFKVYIKNNEITIANKVLPLDNIYVTCFVLGFVLLVIYVIKLIVKVVRDIKLNSYYKEV